MRLAGFLIACLISYIGYETFGPIGLLAGAPLGIWASWDFDRR